MSSQTVALPARVQRAAGWIGGRRAQLEAVRPMYVVSALIGVQWIAVVALALAVRHNGWIYYMGGDQLWHYTHAYLLAHGKLAPTLVGYGWAVILAPIAAFAGPNLVSALPAIVLLNTIVLLPLTTLCMYGIGARLGGRVFGYWTALLWVLIPYLGIPYVLQGYHQKYTELTLPQVLGLGAMADFPSIVVLLVGAYLCLRALDERSHWWGIAAGFAVGFSLGIKPSNAAFLFAPGIVFLVARWRLLLTFAAGLVAPLIVLAFWKIRGYGHLPLFAHSAPVNRLALGSGITSPIHRYLGDNSWAQLHNNLLQLREHLWSDRILEFIVLAGIVALILRARSRGVFVAIWFIAFLLLKGTYVNSSIEDATFWRLLLPAFPVFVLLVASLPLLIPGARLERGRATALVFRRRTTLAIAGVVAALFVLYPIAIVAAANPIHLARLSDVQLNATLVPVRDTLRASAAVSQNGVALRWKRAPSRYGGTFYRVYRTASSGGLLCDPAGACGAAQADTWCRQSRRAPDDCRLAPGAALVGATHADSWRDRPPPGVWVYRVGVGANWLNDPSQGDVYVLGPPVTVTVPPST